MTEAEFRKMFPKASKTFAALNPLISGQEIVQNAVHMPQKRGKGQRRGHLNATEREFSFVLESQKRAGDILSWEFEGITLRFAGVRYTADFAVFCRAYIKLIEIKGPYCKGKFERAVERFRHAKTYYGDRFLFELHQKTKAEGWKRLL